MQWYLEVLRRYAEFDGRSRRKEYWMFQLFNFIIIAGVVMLSGVTANRGGGIGLVLIGVYCLATILPSLAVTVRRLHDTNRSGWWILVSIVPLIGPIALLIFTLQDSEPGTNEYGSNPKALAV